MSSEARGASQTASVSVKLSVNAIRSALKDVLAGKYTEDHINKALQELGLPLDGMCDLKKVLERTPIPMTDENYQDDLMDINWAEFFGRLGLPMSDEEAKGVMTAAKVSFMTKAKKQSTDAASFDIFPESCDLGRDLGSAIDLVSANEEDEEELLKIIEELKVESGGISDDVTPNAEKLVDSDAPNGNPTHD